MTPVVAVADLSKRFCDTSALDHVSFALQALCVEHLVSRRDELEAGVHPVPKSIAQEVATLKLAALGVAIDEPTAEQQSYRESWT